MNFIFSFFDPIVNLNLFLILYPLSVDLNIIPLDCNLLKTCLAENLHLSKFNNKKLAVTSLEKMFNFSKIYGLASLRIGWGHASKKIIDAMNLIKPPFNVNQLAQTAATEALKDKNFVNQSVKHNTIEANKLKNTLEKLNIFSNEVTANFLLLNFDKCKFSAKYVFNKLQSKGILLRSTEDGYNIKNKLRLTIGSKKENIKFIAIIKSIFN